MKKLMRKDDFEVLLYNIAIDFISHKKSGNAYMHFVSGMLLDAEKCETNFYPFYIEDEMVIFENNQGLNIDEVMFLSGLMFERANMTMCREWNKCIDETKDYFSTRRWHYVDK